MKESAMRVSVLTAGLMLAGAIVSISSLGIGAAGAHERKVTCLCDCPDDHKARVHHAEVRPVPRRVAREGYYYRYRTAGPVIDRHWHGAWRVAPDDAVLPGPVYYAPAPAAYGPPPGYYDPGLRVDDRGWTGGVGANGEGGGGGGFEDGYGQLHFNNGGSAQNGPTYNDYNQSFQQNPSVPAPFQSRSMGGLAPAK
jgi:hypothetical protein